MTVDLIKPERLLVPSALDLSTAPPPPDPASHEVDSYACYKARVSAGTPRFSRQSVTIADPFTGPAKAIELRKLTRVCAPAQLDGVAAKKPDGFLTCYQARPAAGSPRHAPRTGVHVSNALGSLAVDTVKEHELCLPAIGPLTVPPDPATIAPAIDPSVPTAFPETTSFLYQGPDAIQTGVSPGAIASRRVAVLRGRVLARDLTPLAGVQLAVVGHPEYGLTHSRSDGAFDLAVNGGGPVTVSFSRVGYLPAQRRAEPRWNEFATLPDVVLLQRDGSLAVDLDAAVAQAVRGKLESDEDGTRRATLIFAPATTATMRLPGGGVEPLTGQIHVHATEYTVKPAGPDAMPGTLPPDSAFTYAVALGVEEADARGATQVDFDPPPTFYVENFLGFPFTQPESVPVGYYDRSIGAWVASDNGQIVRVVSAAGDVDTDGNGSGDNSGIPVSERQQLAGLYAAGTTLWRFGVAHFSDWDANWGFGPPADAGGCGCADPGDGEPPPGEPSCSGGSVIECQTQVLGESVALTGTPFRLRHSSRRVPGYEASRTLRIWLSKGSVPASLMRIEVEVTTAGKTTVQSIVRAPAPPYFPSEITQIWDGKDAYGRAVNGKYPATVRIGYSYVGTYERVARFGYKGNGQKISGSRTRREVTLWETHRVNVERMDVRGIGLGGWTLDVHHVYDPAGAVLHLGGGGRRSAQTRAGTIQTVAGNGGTSSGPDLPVPATSANLTHPSSLAIAADDVMFIAPSGSFGSQVWRLTTDGLVERYAGVNFSFTPEGAQARSTSFQRVGGIAVGPDGLLYVADEGNHRIVRVDAAGIVQRVVGPPCAAAPCPSGFAGDEGLATDPSVRVNQPGRLAFGSEGSLYFVDAGNRRIRRIAPDGRLSTVAGNGSLFGFSPDGAVATAAIIGIPSSLAVGEDGSVYFETRGLDTELIRRVGSNGLLATVAGIPGTPAGFTPDGSPALAARLSQPTALAMSREGMLLFSDQGHLVRRITPDGVLRTSAGLWGETGFVGENGPATLAGLWSPSAIAEAPDGTLAITDLNHNRVRRVAKPSAGLNSAATYLIPSEDGAEVYVFDATGRHLETRDGLVGATLLRFGYDAQGRLASVTDPRALPAPGRVTTVSHDAAGQPTRITAPGGQQTQLAADSHGFLATITNPAAESVQLASTTEGLLSAMIDARGSRWEFSYDASGRLTRNADPIALAMGPAAYFKMLERVAAAETTTSYAVELTTALGRVSNYTVEKVPAGEVRRTDTGPDGHATELQIRPDDRRQLTHPDGTQVVLRRGPDPRFGMLAPVTAQLDVTTPDDPATLGVPDGRHLTVTQTRTASPSDPSLPLTSWSDTLAINADPAGYVRSFLAPTRTLTATTPEQRVQTTTFDAQGRVTAEQISGLYAVSYAYDAKGPLESVTHGPPGGGPLTRTYTLGRDAKLRVTSIEDPLQQVTTLGSFDGADRVGLLTLPGPSPRPVSFGYDANGNMDAITPPGKPAHGFSFSAVNLETAYVPPQPSPAGPLPLPTPPLSYKNTTYEYDRDRQLDLVRRPNAEQINPTYDSAGRLASSTLPTGQGQLDYAYDPTTGQLASVVGPEPGANRPLLRLWHAGPLETQAEWTCESPPCPAGTVEGSVHHGFDDRFQMASESVRDGFGASSDASFTYDRDGLLTSLAAGSETLTITRDPQRAGLVTATELGGPAGITEQRTYNGFGELASSTFQYAGGSSCGGSALYAVIYDAVANPRDRLGRVTRKTETVCGTTTTYDYSYDAAGRLAQVRTNAIVTATYTYDANGNRLTAPGLVTTPIYDGQDRLLQYGATSFTYTPAGELQTKTDASGTASYAYDALGNLRSVDSSDGSRLEFAIDGRSRRVGRRKKVGTTVVDERHWLYADQLRIVAELDGTGALVSRFVYAESPNAPELMYRGGHAYRLVKDQLGSVRLVVDLVDGSIAQRIDYDEYGRVLADTNPGFQPFGFAGGIYDPNPGLVRFGARDFDQAVGRWIAKDSALFRGGTMNLYEYAGEDPVNEIDPTGRWYVDINCSGGAIAGVTGGVFLGPDGVHPYVGGGLVTPGSSCSISWSPGSPSPGQGSVQLGGTCGAAAAAGTDFSGNGFWEVGGGWPPGAGLTVYYTW